MIKIVRAVHGPVAHAEPRLGPRAVGLHHRAQLARLVSRVPDVPAFRRHRLRIRHRGVAIDYITFTNSKLVRQTVFIMQTGSRCVS